MKELVTKRLLLRKLREDDSSSIFNSWASDPEVTKYLQWDPHESIEDTKKILAIWLNEYDDPKTYRWGIALKDSGELIGAIDVVGYSKDQAPIIGYCLARKYWNNGYMTEAFKAVVDFLFDEGFTSIRICAIRENIASNKVILKNGFTLFRQEDYDHKGNKVIINQYRLDNY